MSDSSNPEQARATAEQAYAAAEHARAAAEQACEALRAEQEQLQARLHQDLARRRPSLELEARPATPTLDEALLADLLRRPDWVAEAYRTGTPMGAPTSCSSCQSDSDSATTPCLETL